MAASFQRFVQCRRARRLGVASCRCSDRLDVSFKEALKVVCTAGYRSWWQAGFFATTQDAVQGPPKKMWWMTLIAQSSAPIVRLLGLEQRILLMKDRSPGLTSSITVWTAKLSLKSPTTSPNHWTASVDVLWDERPAGRTQRDIRC